MWSLVSTWLSRHKHRPSHWRQVTRCIIFFSRMGVWPRLGVTPLLTLTSESSGGWGGGGRALWGFWLLWGCCGPTAHHRWFNIGLHLAPPPPVAKARPVAKSWIRSFNWPLDLLVQTGCHFWPAHDPLIIIIQAPHKSGSIGILTRAYEGTFSIVFAVVGDLFVCSYSHVGMHDWTDLDTDCRYTGHRFVPPVFMRHYI